MSVSYISSKLIIVFFFHVWEYSIRCFDIFKIFWLFSFIKRTKIHSIEIWPETMDGNVFVFFLRILLLNQLNTLDINWMVMVRNRSRFILVLSTSALHTPKENIAPWDQMKNLLIFTTTKKNCTKSVFEPVWSFELNLFM